MQSIGIDFGTTNTVLALCGADGEAHVQRFTHERQPFEAFRTTLSFRRNPASVAEPRCEAGPRAIDSFIESPEDTRFLQSFKSFAASAAFSGTAIFLRRYKVEDLLASFIDRARFHTGLKSLPQRLVAGRPVTFAGHNPDEALARQRYDAAFQKLGFRQISYVLEPGAAAQLYAQRLTGAATILVGEFGGGTSDFSVVRFERGPGGMTAQALGHSGVGIASDTFGYRIVEACVDQVLAKTGLGPEHIDCLFLTGGTSYVPAVRRLFLRRFGPERIETRDQLLSIAKGFALISASKDLARWAVA